MTVLASTATASTASIQAAPLSTGRLHLNEGPIDLIIGAEGPPDAVARAYHQARSRFEGLLGELVSELDILRAPITSESPQVRGPVARRMIAATALHKHAFITPMAAVAGAVADEILAAMTTVAELQKAYVNDGGDIAIYLAPNAEMRIGLVTQLQNAHPGGTVAITSDMPVRGIATSGAEGRSLSLGIADAVTVLAPSAATADAAATLIANAVNIDHPAIERAPAGSIDPDSDLGDRLVTVGRGALPSSAIQDALALGINAADGMISRGLIAAALLSCDGHVRTTDAASSTANPLFLS